MKFFIALMIIINTVIFILGGFFFMLLLNLGPISLLLLHILIIMMLYFNMFQAINAWRGVYRVSPLSFYLNFFSFMVFLLVFIAPAALDGKFNDISTSMDLFLYISANTGLALWMRKKNRDSLKESPPLTGRDCLIKT